MKNNLWKQKYKPKFGIRLAPIFKDELCQDCVYIGRCDKGACYWMKHIDGNTARKEKLITDMNTKDMEYRDYKDDLVEMMEHRQNRINHVMKITTVKHRAIAILLLAGITQIDIAKLFCMSIKQINRISFKIR